MDAYKLLQKMVFNKRINSTVVRAVKVRLEAILSQKERDYLHWQENISHKLTETRRKEIRRKFEKVITGYKITIHDLTPFHERIEDVPVLIKRKKPKNDL